MQEISMLTLSMRILEGHFSIREVGVCSLGLETWNYVFEFNTFNISTFPRFLSQNHILPLEPSLVQCVANVAINGISA
jgi:hypothetical protein